MARTRKGTRWASTRKGTRATSRRASRRSPPYYTKWPKKMGRKRCARGSYRVKAPNKSTRLVFCCAPGKWKKNRCQRSMELHVIYKKHGFKKRRK